MIACYGTPDKRIDACREPRSAIRDAAGSDDVSYAELRGAPHYLEGHRREALEGVEAWLRARFC